MSRRRGGILGVGLVLLLLGLLGAGCGGGKSTITLYDGQWESLWVNNAIFEFIAEEGYGFPVESVVQRTEVMRNSLPSGEVDLNLEGWQQNILDWYNEEIDRGRIVNMGMIYEGGPQFFIIPRWVADENDIKTVEDMQDHWELFQDTQDPNKGVFYNCPIGFACPKINEVKLEAYGLTRYYHLESAASNVALEATLARAQDNRQPVFGFFWEPNGLIGQYEWHVLEEPPYTADCAEKILAAVDDKSLRPLEQACAYETTPIDRLAHAGFESKAPELAKMLRNMVVGVEPLNETLAWAKDSQVEEREKAAVYYLRTYEDRWKTWVTPEAHENIKEALEEAGET